MKQQLKYAEITSGGEKSGPLYLQLAEELRHQIGVVCLNESERRSAILFTQSAAVRRTCFQIIMKMGKWSRTAN